MFIQTEPTPNPATLKFIPGKTVLGDGTVDFRDKSEATASPLAQRLFGVDGVTGVLCEPVAVQPRVARPYPGQAPPHRRVDQLRPVAAGDEDERQFAEVVRRVGNAPCGGEQPLDT